jgi:hypothetical protein
VARDLRDPLAATGGETLHIARLTLGERLPRKFHSKLREELLNGEIFYSVKEIRLLVDAGTSTATAPGRTPRWLQTVSTRFREFSGVRDFLLLSIIWFQ